MRELQISNKVFCFLCNDILWHQRYQDQHPVLDLIQGYALCHAICNDMWSRMIWTRFSISEVFRQLPGWRWHVYTFSQHPQRHVAHLFYVFPFESVQTWDVWLMLLSNGTWIKKFSLSTIVIIVNKWSVLQVPNWLFVKDFLKTLLSTINWKEDTSYCLGKRFESLHLAWVWPSVGVWLKFDTM